MRACLEVLQLRGVFAYRQQDAQGFRQELYAFINDVDQLWTTFDGHDEHLGVDFEENDFAGYPTLTKYTHSLECTAQTFDHSVLGDEWIMFQAHGGAYSPDDALHAAIATLKNKTSKYATLKTDDRLRPVRRLGDNAEVRFMTDDVTTPVRTSLCRRRRESLV